MNILQLCPKIPYPPTDGGRKAVFEPLRRLASRGHHITLLTFGTKSGESEPLERSCTVKWVRHDTSTRLIPALLNVFSPIPYTISKYKSTKMADMIHQTLSQQKFDLAQIEHLHMSHYLPLIKEHKIPVVLRQHNVESVIANRFASETRMLYRLYAKLQIAKLHRFEAWACAQADACLAITETDAQILQTMAPNINPIVISAGVDLDYYQARPVSEEKGSIVFIGSMDWPPNMDAVLWFCSEIFPIVKRFIPNAKWYIVGKNPPKSIQQLSGKDIIVTNFVEDVREYFSRAAVFIVPLRIGSGMRLKILEAMAMGKAIVSTTIGAEGIRAVHGRDILLADDPASFADSVCRLLKDPDLRKQLGHDARKLVVSRYTWEQTVDLLEKAYQEVVRK